MLWKIKAQFKGETKIDFRDELRLKLEIQNFYYKFILIFYFVIN